jgi:hypothetical protein
MSFEYDVAFSFAGEDRMLVEGLADAMKAMGFRVFYDKYEEAVLWGKDLYQHLDDVYRNKAKFCVIVASRAYAAKVWTKHELQSAQARAINDKHEYILPLRIDETDIPGIRPTTAYINIRGRTIEDLASLLATKIRTGRISADVPKPTNVTLSVVDDHGNAPSSGELSRLRSELEALHRESVPRYLSAQATTILSDQLSEISPEHIGLFSAPADEEAAQFREQIAAVFEQANPDWLVESRTAIYAAQVVGVHVVYKIGEPWESPLDMPEIAEPIARALRAGGIRVDLVPLRERPTDFRVFIAVGKKPSGA